jgi:hypothetical protein
VEFLSISASEKFSLGQCCNMVLCALTAAALSKSGVNLYEGVLNLNTDKKLFFKTAFREIYAFFFNLCSHPALQFISHSPLNSTLLSYSNILSF